MTLLSSTSRFLRSGLLLGAMLVAAACQDAPVAPAADGPALPPNLGVYADYSDDRESADIVVTPTGGWFTLGSNAIYFPPNSICDLSSSYGPDEWDKPCQPAQGAVSFHVEILRDGNCTWLGVTPAARFVPAKGARHRVMLYMDTGMQPEKLAAKMPPILGVPAPGEPGIDEAAIDRTLRTRYLPKSSIAYRRIKHFSGYQVGMD